MNTFQKFGNVVVEHQEKMPLKRLIEETDKGIITKGIIGAYSSDYISGDFSVTLDECSLIENGNMSKIENVTIGGSIFDLLMSTECVSDEKVQSGHFIIPYIKIFWSLL